MSKEMIENAIRRLIIMRRDADVETQKKISIQLDKLYEFKYELLKGEDYV